MDSLTQAALRELATNHIGSQPPQPSPVVIVPDLLSGAAHDELLRTLIAAESSYVSNLEDGRRALVLLESPPEVGLMLDAVVGRLDELALALGLDPADVTAPSVDQLLCSAHGHGDFLGPHHDIADPYADRTVAGSVDGGQRILTFVYYLHGQPAQFTGGELRLYDRWMVGGRPKAATSFIEVRPTDNMLIAFLPSSRHEVLTVRSPPGVFADRRFAIAGFGMWEPG